MASCGRGQGSHNWHWPAARGEILNVRTRADEHGHQFRQVVRARPRQEGTAPPLRTGAIPWTGAFQEIQDVCGQVMEVDHSKDCRITMQWPLPVSRYLRDVRISHLTEANELVHLLRNPREQLGMPILFSSCIWLITVASSTFMAKDETIRKTF